MFFAQGDDKPIHNGLLQRCWCERGFFQSIESGRWKGEVGEWEVMQLFRKLTRTLVQVDVCRTSIGRKICFHSNVICHFDCPHSNWMPLGSVLVPHDTHSGAYVERTIWQENRNRDGIIVIIIKFREPFYKLHQFDTINPFYNWFPDSWHHNIVQPIWRGFGNTRMGCTVMRAISSFDSPICSQSNNWEYIFAMDFCVGVIKSEILLHGYCFGSVYVQSG